MIETFILHGINYYTRTDYSLLTRCSREYVVRLQQRMEYIEGKAVWIEYPTSSSSSSCLQEKKG